jgi:hypothetical protein
VLDDQLQLAELLDHRDDVAPELGREDHGLDELAVLEAVADDRHRLVARAGRQRQHREQLGLAARLEPEVQLTPMSRICSQTWRCWFTLIG